MASRVINVWRSLDWFTVLLYTLLVLAGWVCIYAASYSFDNASMFDFAERSGKQLVWIGCSLILGFLLLMIDWRFYAQFSMLIYTLLMLLLLATIFLAPEIKGSRSWLVLGPVSLQPAEFAKFATSLAIASLFNKHGFSLENRSNLLLAIAFVLLPMALILLQNETGSALVYTSLIFVFYREGLSGLVPFSALWAIIFFVVTLKYSSQVWGIAPTGEVIVLGLILLVVLGMVWLYLKEQKAARNIAIGYALAAVTGYALEHFGVRFNYLHAQLGLLGVTLIYLLGCFLEKRVSKWWVVIGFALSSFLFVYSVEYAFNDILKPHQQIRIKVALGMEEDLHGAGYNVNQSKIAIGSGGLTGKGFLNGTQTKLKYVPEQDTDFIFCTIGEERGFVGSTLILLLFLTLILRILFLAERQHSRFGRAYAYCVAGILFFHLAINVGMVLGLCPVIGIPLPFFSYGGSSLWSFTILLFILLRIDVSRLENF